MRKHLAAFTQQNTSASAGFQNIPFLPDQVLTPFGVGFQVPMDTMLLWAYLLSNGTFLTRGQISAPSLRPITLPDIIPVDNVPHPRLPFNIQMFLDRPFRLRGSEEVDINAVNNNAGDAIYCAVMMGDDLPPAPDGQVYTMHGSSTTAAVAGAWTQIAMTWDQLPQAGTYSLVGSYHASANGVVHRFIHPSQVERPGSVSGVNTLQMMHSYFSYRLLGEYLKFTDWQFPQVEVLCDAADAVHDVWMQIVKVG